MDVNIFYECQDDVRHHIKEKKHKKLRLKMLFYHKYFFRAHMHLAKNKSIKCHGYL